MEQLLQSQQKLALYIDDIPEFITLMDLVLKRTGVKVVGAKEGIEGLNKIHAIKPNLVLLDLMLPRMSGWEVFKKMRTDDELKNIPIIIISVYSEMMDRKLALESVQADGYITKPFSIQDLLLNVQRVLHLAG